MNYKKNEGCVSFNELDIHWKICRGLHIFTFTWFTVSVEALCPECTKADLDDAKTACQKLAVTLIDTETNGNATHVCRWDVLDFDYFIRYNINKLFYINLFYIQLYEYFSEWGQKLILKYNTWKKNRITVSHLNTFLIGFIHNLS